MTPLEWIFVAVVTVTSASRITRLVTFDVFPPSVWLRTKWDALTNDGDWSELVHCGYCFSFWATLGVLGSGWALGWHPVWWLVNGAFGASYLAAILMTHDGE